MTAFCIEKLIMKMTIPPYKMTEKNGEYSKKGSQVHNQRLQKQGRRMLD
jgi:hypothetical protein